MSAEDLSQVGALIAGPASAVVVCVLVLGALYKLTVNQLVPLASKALDRHLAQVDTLLEQQRKESASLTRALSSFERALQAIDQRLARLETHAADEPDGRVLVARRDG